MSGPFPCAGLPSRTRTGRVDPVRLYLALGWTPFGEVLETGQVEVDSLLYPMGTLAGLFQALPVVAELHANLGPALIAWLEEGGARLGFAQFLGKLVRRNLLRLADLQTHPGAAFLGPLRPLLAGLIGRDADLHCALGHAHRRCHYLYLLVKSRAS